MKQNTDFIQAFLFENADIRGKIVRLQTSTCKIMEQHNYPMVIRDILGELLLASVLLSSSLKYEGQLTLHIQSDGALKMLVAKCNHLSEIRGLAQWDEEANIDELKQAFFSGQLIITIENSRDNQRYQSVIDINHQTISSALETYFTQSEQVPTKIILAHDKEFFAGFLIQKMPSHSIEQLEFWQHVSILANTLTSDELIHWDNERLLKNIFHEENIRLFDTLPILFNCICSEEKSKNTLRLLGKQESTDYFLTNKILTVTCEYCNQQYNFTKSDIEQLFH